MIPPGHGSLSIAHVDGRSAILGCRAESPLRLLTPDVTKLASWCYVSSFGGGLVDGDATSLEVELGVDARLVLATQASTKIYRGASSQRLSARVAKGGLLAVVPDPIVPFAEADYRQSITIELEEDASLALTDAYTAGRSARGERWQLTRYESRISVRRGGVPVVLDPLCLDPAHGPLLERMGRWDAFATIVLLGPKVSAAAVATLEAIGKTRVRSTDDVVVAASPVADGAIVRIMATEVRSSTHVVREHLAFLAPLVGEDPFRGRALSRGRRRI
jgi:urease accessory protein